MEETMKAIETAQAILATKSYSVQSVNRFSGKWVTESTTNDYLQARYDRTQLRKAKGRTKARIIWTLTGELAD